MKKNIRISELRVHHVNKRYDGRFFFRNDIRCVICKEFRIIQYTMFDDKIKKKQDRKAWIYHRVDGPCEIYFKLKTGEVFRSWYLFGKEKTEEEVLQFAIESGNISAANKIIFKKYLKEIILFGARGDAKS